jgi:putative membrane protein
MMIKPLRLAALNFVIGCGLLGMTACRHQEPVQAVHNPVLTQADRNFIARAEEDNIQERAISQLVAAKSGNKRVRNYADTLFKGHSDALEKLDAIMQKYSMKPQASPEEQQEATAQLARLSRRSLDRQFIKLMVDNHAKAIAVFQQEANSAKDGDVRHYAIDQLPMLDNDLKQARELQTKMGLVRKK